MHAAESLRCYPCSMRRHARPLTWLATAVAVRHASGESSLDEQAGYRARHTAD